MSMVVALNDLAYQIFSLKRKVKVVSRTLVSGVACCAMIAVLGDLASATSKARACCDVEVGITEIVVRSGEYWDIDTRIRNGSDQSYELRVWSCSYDRQWKTSNDSVSLNRRSCRKNVIHQIRLRPGDSYVRPLSIRITPQAEHIEERAIIFRLGFEPATPSGCHQAWAGLRARTEGTCN